jgi:internalin A
MNAISAPPLLADPQLRPYLDDVRQWHGYVRFLGLPTLIDNPDTPMSDLFVMPALHDQPVGAESDIKTWPEGRSVLSALERNKRLVILGDPGSGKSTIVNWLAWMLAGGTQMNLSPTLTGVLPLPLVARELKLNDVSDFDDLIDAFLQRPVAAKLNRSSVFERLAQGGAMVLLDGLDEVSASQRQTLTDALNEGVNRYPASSFVATTRVVGYDASQLDAPRASHSSRLRLARALAAPEGSFPTTLDERLANLHEAIAVGPRWTTLYVMPFDDGRIAAFAAQWYSLRSFAELARRDAQQFVQAVHANPAIEALARLPQLLTLMALVHRIGARLPDGRAILYGQIAEAYLRSIDSARGLAMASDEAPWHEKQRWLARIGFEMQLLRQNATSGNRRDLLAPRSEVLRWVYAAMRQSGYPADAQQIDDYLDWVARRSGLLLPRGDGYFSFVHLSFQEYFAALYISEHLTDADWIMAQSTAQPHSASDTRISIGVVQEWGSDLLWQEVFVFIAEGFATRPRDAGRLAKWLFGEGLADLQTGWAAANAETADEIPSAIGAQAELLSRFVLNPHSGWTKELRDGGWQQLLAYIERFEKLFEAGASVAERPVTSRILSQESFASRFWSWLEERSPSFLNLIGTSAIFMRDIPSNPNLRWIDAQKIADAEIQSLPKRFPNLVGLQILSAANLSTLSGIESSRLKFLYITNSQISDLQPIAKMANLERLEVASSKVKSLEPLAGLTKIRSLYIHETLVDDLDPLKNCPMLETLAAQRTRITTLAPLVKNQFLKDVYIDDNVELPNTLRAREQAEALSVTRFPSIAKQ